MTKSTLLLGAFLIIKRTRGVIILKINKNFKYVFPFKYENHRILKEVGKEQVHITLNKTEELEYNAQDIIDIKYGIKKEKDSIFHGKLIKKGIIENKVIYADKNNFVRYQIINFPFTTVADIKNLIPEAGIKTKTKLVGKKIDYKLVKSCLLKIKIVIILEITASNWVEKRLRVCNSNIVSFKQVSDQTNYRYY